MLFRRTCKLVEFENATKALEKAKPKNQEAVSYPGEDIFIIIPTTFKAPSWVPSSLRREKIENASNVFRPHSAGGILKTQ